MGVTLRSHFQMEQEFGTVVASASLGKEHIKFGFNLLDSIPKEVLALVSASSFVCITDHNINKLYGERIRNSFKTKGIELLVYEIEPGESSKSRKTKEKIEDWMIEQKCNRDTCLLGRKSIMDLTTQHLEVELLVTWVDLLQQRI